MNNSMKVPVMITNEHGEEELAYKDVSNLGIEDLLKLRKDLMGEEYDNTRAFDSILYKCHLSGTNFGYDISRSATRRTNEEYIKRERIRLKRRRQKNVKYQG